MRTTENICAEELRHHDWQVIRNGWPDLLLFRGNRRVVLEIKRKHDCLHKHRRYMLSVLASWDIEVFVLRGNRLYRVSATGGLTSCALSELGISVGILDRLQDNPRTTRCSRPKPIVTERTKSMLKLISDGESLSAVALKFGLSRQRIAQIVGPVGKCREKVLDTSETLF